MQCPKCPGLMQTYNRNGVSIDQCGNCRGIFLDVGELEALSQLEARHAAPPPQPGYAPPPPQPGYAAPGYAAPGYAAVPVYPAHGGHYGGHYGHRKKSWAHMLFSS